MLTYESFRSTLSHSREPNKLRSTLATQLRGSTGGSVLHLWARGLGRGRAHAFQLRPALS